MCVWVGVYKGSEGIGCCGVCCAAVWERGPLVLVCGFDDGGVVWPRVRVTMSMWMSVRMRVVIYCIRDVAAWQRPGGVYIAVIVKTRLWMCMWVRFRARTAARQGTPAVQGLVEHGVLVGGVGG